MRHADEGLLHAWLDGALVGEEADAVRQHLTLCANCRARLEEAGRVRDQADTILAGAVPAELQRPPFADVVAQAQALAAEAHLPAPRLRLGAGARSVSWRTLGWAASILLAVGAGWWGHELMRQPQRLAIGNDNAAAQQKARQADRTLLLKLEPSTASDASEPAEPVELPAPAPVAAAAPAGGKDANSRVVGQLAQGEAPAQATARDRAAEARAGALTEAAPAPARAAERGFALHTPAAVPPDIPPPSARSAANEADFTSKPQARDLVALNVEAAPTFTPYTVAPELRNREEVRQALERAYPPVMRDAGIGGATIVWALIDEKGAVPKTQVRTSSGFPDLDAAALSVTRTMRFSPGLNRDRAVKVWVQLPIIFKADPNAPYDPVRSSRLAQEAAPQAGRVAAGAAPAAIASAERADAAGIARKAGEPMAGVVAVAGLPIIRSLPRIGPGELSRVLQRLPSGDTIEVAALAPAGTTEAPPTVADAPRALAQQPGWSGAARRDAITVSRTNAQGTVTIRGVLPRDSLETLLRRVRFPAQQADK